MFVYKLSGCGFESRYSHYRLDRKRIFAASDEVTRRKVTGKGTPESDRPHKVDSAELIEAICRIAIPGSAAHERRRNKVIRTVKTLDQLTEALNYEGYDLKRSSVDLYLLQEILEHWRESDTYPQHLSNFANPKNSSHISTTFAQSSVRALEEIAATLGPEEVIFNSIDDKAKVPIGITAAKKQTPLPMDMEY